MSELDTRSAQRDLEIDRRHFGRMWEGRNDERVVQLGPLTYDRAQRRANIRANIRGQRSARDRGAR